MEEKHNNFQYEALADVYEEWSELEYDGSIWEYLNLTNNQFDEWIKKIKTNVYDA